MANGSNFQHNQGGAYVAKAATKLIHLSDTDGGWKADNQEVLAHWVLETRRYTPHTLHRLVGV